MKLKKKKVLIRGLHILKQCTNTGQLFPPASSLHAKLSYQSPETASSLLDTFLM
ncbi:hypothetical protein EXN66_Car019700 [Channa argus]|uniref:Uncharacterized protein n=1 Tax=Channa argus TaxID=215402 RepID=A0A6G1QN53_CHAAH|nr:hypothetical protein EXN66_Car019700 [Channa argus]